MRRPLALLLAALSLALAGCAPAAPGGPPPPRGASPPPTCPPPSPSRTRSPSRSPHRSPTPRQEAVDRALSGMTLEEKVGQLFFARCPEMHAAALASSTTWGATSSLAGTSRTGPGRSDRLHRRLPAGRRYPSAHRSGRGGRHVVRVSSNPELAPHRFQSPQKLALASSGQGDVFAEDAWEKSSLLLSLGINVNFAPVADVSTDPGDFIYDRTLGPGTPRPPPGMSPRWWRPWGDCGIGSVLKQLSRLWQQRGHHTGDRRGPAAYEGFVASDFLSLPGGIAAGADAVLGEPQHCHLHGRRPARLPVPGGPPGPPGGAGL